MAIARTVRLGDTEVHRIGLGTNRLTHTPRNLELVREAAEAGVGHIDSAHIYTRGESELTIGEALSPPPLGCVVGTKGGHAPGDGGPSVLRGQIDESLRRLRTDSIALYYLHRVDPQTPLEESLGVIKDYQDAGKIRLAGVSQVSIDQLECARSVLPIAAVQNHYNLSERTYEAEVDHCAREGIVFVPYFPLRGATPHAVTTVADRHGATPAQIVLAWLLRRSPVMLPIPGTLSIEHVKENLGALEIELTDEEFNALS